MTTFHPLTTTSTVTETKLVAKVWQNLTRPAKGVPADEHQRASFLATVSLILVVLTTISLFVLMIVIFASTGETTYLTMTYAGIFVIAIAYVISRTKHYNLSAYIIAYTMIVDIIGMFFVVGYSLEAASALVLPVLFGGFVLGWRATLIAGIVSTSTAILGYILLDSTAEPSSAATVAIVIAISTALVTYSTYQRNQFLAALQASRSQLQDQVILAQQARERAERSDQVKSAFLASMSHELRTPLNAVINFTRFVIDGDTGPINEQQSELLTEVVSSAKHLLNLINDVLDMSKIEAGSLSLFVQDDVNVSALLTSAMTTGRSLLGDKPVQLRADIADNLPLVRGDKQRLLQILLNLLSNACKFTEQGEIVVHAHRADDEIVIAVTDTGPGIALEDQEMVFEAFKQTATGLRQAGGTGLGMPIARNLAEAHGGRLWLESEYGHGATFYFAMPVNADELVPTLA